MGRVPLQSVSSRPTIYPNSSIPGLYIINARSVAKPDALAQLQAELIGYHLDMAIITETHLKQHHPESVNQVNGF